MALVDNEQFTENDLGDRSKRVTADVLQPKEFASVGAEEELPVLTPVSINTATGKWAAWDANGSNGLDQMEGLVWPDPITVKTSGEVLGTVMLAGKVHYEDVLAAVEDRAVEVEADLQTELRSGQRSRGIMVYGLSQVR